MKWIYFKTTEIKESGKKRLHQETNQKLFLEKIHKIEKYLVSQVERKKREKMQIIGDMCKIVSEICVLENMGEILRK